MITKSRLTLYPKISFRNSNAAVNLVSSNVGFFFSISTGKVLI